MTQRGHLTSMNIRMRPSPRPQSTDWSHPLKRGILLRLRPDLCFSKAHSSSSCIVVKNDFDQTALMSIIIMRSTKSFPALLLLFLSTLDGMQSIQPSVLFSLADDRNNTLREHLYTRCSSVDPSSLFLCSDELLYYVRFHFDLSLAPFQTQTDRCGLLFHYHSYGLDPPMKSDRRLLIPIDVRRTSRSLLVFLR